jgi:hypothetical protein
VIRNLPSSTKIESISICAVNQADLKGKKALVTWGEPVNHTQPCSRFYQIQQEIQRVQSHIGEFIDSDFYTVTIPPSLSSSLPPSLSLSLSPLSVSVSLSLSLSPYPYPSPFFSSSHILSSPLCCCVFVCQP